MPGCSPRTSIGWWSKVVTSATSTTPGRDGVPEPRIPRCEDSRRSRTSPSTPLTARAAQALLIGGQAHARIAVLDLDGVAGGGIFEANGGQLSPARPIEGVHHLSNAIAEVARTLGVAPQRLVARGAG